MDKVALLLNYLKVVVDQRGMKGEDNPGSQHQAVVVGRQFH